MPSLEDRVLLTIRRHDLLPAGRRVLVGLSGGSDSVALLHLLKRLEPQTGCPVAGAAHFNHQLRGEAAADDERFCAAMAAALSLPFEVDRADVRAIARERGASIEDTARDLRYAFLGRAAARLRADRIAVGHTRDDQAETFLLRLLRGAGPRGLAGIYPRAGALVRPLLDVSRDELRAFLAAEQTAFREDESNRDLSNPRNRVRHELLPWLRGHFSPGVIGVLAREADIARADDEILDALATEAAPDSIAPAAGGAIALEVPRLLARPRGIRRRLVRLAMARAAGGRFIGFDHVEAVLALMERPGGGAVDLPGHRAARRGDRVVLTPRAGRRGAPPHQFRRPLSVPGEVSLADAGWIVSAERAPEGAPADVRAAVPGVDPVGHMEVVAIDADRMAGAGLLVRSRQPGDALRPLGLGGRKKLQDLFVDRKVLQSERDRVPIVVDDRGRIVWVVGHALAEDFRITDRTRAVLILKARRLGGTG